MLQKSTLFWRKMLGSNKIVLKFSNNSLVGYSWDIIIPYSKFLTYSTFYIQGKYIFQQEYFT